MSTPTAPRAGAVPRPLAPAPAPAVAPPARSGRVRRALARAVAAVTAAHAARVPF